MTRHLLALALLASWVTSAPQRADACTQAPTDVRYPRNGGLAPPNTRIIGTGPGDVVHISYTDGSTISGSFQRYYQDRLHSVWIFTPDAPLIVGETVAVRPALTASVSFTVDATPDLTPPVYGAAATDLLVEQMTFVEVEDPGGSCGNPLVGEVRTGVRLNAPTAHDDRAPDEVLIYYAHNGWGWAASLGSAGASDCLPPARVIATPSAPCESITVEDPSGNAVNLPEICGTAVDRTVRFQGQFCFDVVVDGGLSVPDTGGADDAGATGPADAGSDAGVPVMLEDQGCACSSSAGGGSMLAGVALLLGLWLLRRR